MNERDSHGLHEIARTLNELFAELRAPRSDPGGAGDVVSIDDLLEVEAPSDELTEDVVSIDDILEVEAPAADAVEEPADIVSIDDILEVQTPAADAVEEPADVVSIDDILEVEAPAADMVEEPADVVSIDDILEVEAPAADAVEEPADVVSIDDILKVDATDDDAEDLPVASSEMPTLILEEPFRPEPVEAPSAEATEDIASVEALLNATLPAAFVEEPEDEVSTDDTLEVDDPPHEATEDVVAIDNLLDAEASADVVEEEPVSSADMPTLVLEEPFRPGPVEDEPSEPEVVDFAEEPEEVVAIDDLLEDEEPTESTAEMGEEFVSIDDLLEVEEELPEALLEAGEEVVSIEDLLEVEEPEEEKPAVPTVGAVLRDAVEAFLNETGDREEQLEEVRAAGEAARSTNQLDALAEAVDELLVREPDDPESRELVKHLMNAAVESRMAIRLGTIPDAERRSVLVDAYSGMGASMAAAAAEAMAASEDRTARRTYMSLLLGMGEDGVAVVESMSVDSRWYVARNGVVMIGEIGGDAALGRLTGALAHGDGRVRREALAALAKIGGEDAGLLSMGLLDDHEADVREAAARTLSALKVQRAVRPLLDLLAREKEQAVVEQVLRALGRIGDPGAVPVISKKAAGGLLARNSTEVRVAAIAALGDIGTPQALKTISAAAQDKNPEIQRAAQAVWISAAEAKEDDSTGESANADESNAGVEGEPDDA